MKHLLVALLLNAFACSGTTLPHDIDLDHDAIVTLNGYVGASQSEMNNALNEVTLDFKSKFQYKEIYITGTSIRFLPGHDKCSDIGAPCTGTLNGFATQYGITVYYGDNPMLPLNLTAYKHELQHVMMLRSHVVDANKQDAYIAQNFGY